MSAGHRVTKGRAFRTIDPLVAGDQINFTVGATHSVYEVYGDDVVTPDATSIVNQSRSPHWSPVTRRLGRATATW